jgi:exodeoxyribonuclease III
MKLISWNVNGLRAALKAGFADFLTAERPTAICLQEIKATPDDLDPAHWDGWHVQWNPAEKKGYSGTLIATQAAPMQVWNGIGQPAHDTEGRVVTVETADHFIVNVYTPNAQRELARLPYRLEWDAAFRAYVVGLDAKKPVLICGDLNVSHEEIDLSNPKANRKNAGFSDAERASFGQLLGAGFADTFRRQHPGEKGHHTWWTYRGEARAKNVGWRLDYWLVSERLMPQVRRSFIRPDVLGSDHCPILLELT